MAAKTHNTLADMFFKPAGKFEDETTDGSTMRSWEQRLSVNQYTWARDLWARHLKANAAEVEAAPKGKYHADYPFGAFERGDSKFTWMMGTTEAGGYYLLVYHLMTEADKLLEEAEAVLKASQRFYDKLAELDLDGLSEAEEQLLALHKEAMSKALVAAAARYTAAKQPAAQTAPKTLDEQADEMFDPDSDKFGYDLKDGDDVLWDVWFAVITSEKASAMFKQAKTEGKTVYTLRGGRRVMDGQFKRGNTHYVWEVQEMTEHTQFKVSAVNE